MRMAQNDQDARAGLRGYVQLNKYTHTHTQQQHGEEDIPMLGYIDSRQLGGRYTGRTDPIPLR